MANKIDIYMVFYFGDTLLWLITSSHLLSS